MRALRTFSVDGVADVMARTRRGGWVGGGTRRGVFDRLALRCALVVIACVSALGGFAQSAFAQFQRSGVNLLSHIDLNGFGTPVPGNGNSCWGYVSPSGREYAIMGLSNKVAFVEITNPAAPVVVATIAHTNSLWADIKTYQQYAYVSNESGGGLQVIDMGNIDNGVVTLVRNVTLNGISTTHTLAVDEVSGYLYSCGANINNGGLTVFSLANPSNPTYAGQWSNMYVHEAQVVTYTTGPNAGRQVAFCFNGGNGLYILDVTNKSNITILGNTPYPGLNYCHQGWLNEDRSLLYVNDEIDGPAEGVPYGLTRIFNVSNLNAPTLAGTYECGVPGAIDHNLYIRGRYMYQSNYTSGLRVVDIFNPLSPVEVAWIDTYPADNSPQYEGNWNNYPYFPSGTVIISDINAGLFVVRVDLDPLTFVFPGGTPTQIVPSTPTPLVVDVNGVTTPVNPASVRLFTSINNAPFVEQTMTSVDANTFTGTLPATPCLSTLRYYVRAANTSGGVYITPSDAPLQTFIAESRPSATTLFFYDMETAAGWTGGAPGDTATTGQWQRGDPEPTIAQTGDDHTPAPGVNCWATGLLAGAQSGSFDVDGGLTTLLSPVISLANTGSSAYISYWRWYSNGLGGAPNTDTFRVDLSNDGGATWVNVETVGPSGPGTGPGWNFHEFRVSDFRPATASMRLRFIAEDAGTGSLVEAAVDDVRVFSFACPSGPTCDSIDVNNDNSSFDPQDIEAFLSVYSEGPCVPASATCNDIDFNNDNSLFDPCDIASFLLQYSEGPCTACGQ